MSKQNENKEKYMEKFMNNPSMIEKYPDEKKRYSAGISEWESKNKKKDSKEELNRIDFFGLYPDVEYELTDRFEMTPEGYLTGRAVVTNIGVFPYLNSDGTINRELRPPEEVFSDESLLSLKNKPITNLHPSEKVDATNIKKYQVGFTGDRVFRDSYHVSIQLTITDQQTIEDIKNGKSALSCGYTLDLEQKSGNYLGTNYDSIQRNIIYNHVAVVDRGRAGDAAKMRIDSNEDFLKSLLNNKEENIMPNNFKKVKIDGVEFEAEAEVIKSYTLTKEKCDSLQLQLDGQKKEFSKVEAERDTLKEKLDEKEKEIEELKNDTSKIDEAVKEKLFILKAAKDAEIDVKEDMSNSDIKKAVILKVSPNAKLDGKDEVYIDARFDGAIEDLSEKKTTKNRKDVHGDFLDDDENSDSELNDDETLNSDEAYEKQLKEMKDRSRTFYAKGE